MNESDHFDDLDMDGKIIFNGF